MGSIDWRGFQDDQTINIVQLDDEAVRQPVLMGKWAELSVKARAKYDRAKAVLDVVEAELSLRCRADPEEFGISKSTEAAISQAVMVHRERIVARDEMLVAKEESEAYAAAVNTLEHKKRMIEVLVQLHGQQYFASPVVAREYDGRVRVSDGKLESSQLEKMQRRSKKKLDKGESV